MQFNREQQAAVEANNNFLIISAAAGSGKTTVLVEKILQSIKNGHDLGQMLIITFTREAASNMRIKLKEKLEKAHAEDPSALIANAIDEVDCAQISTIHSFCSTILRSQFHKVGIDPLFAISEGNETQPIFDEAFRQAINELLSESTEPGQRQMVQEMLKAFTQADMLEMVRQAYHRLMGLPDSFSLARRSIQDIDQPEDRNPWIQEIKESIRLEWLGMLQYMESGKDMMASPDALSGPADIFENDLQLLLRMLVGG